MKNSNRNSFGAKVKRILLFTLCAFSIIAAPFISLAETDQSVKINNTVHNAASFEMVTTTRVRHLKS